MLFTNHIYVTSLGDREKKSRRYRSTDNIGVNVKGSNYSQLKCDSYNMVEEDIELEFSRQARTSSIQIQMV